LQRELADVKDRLEAELAAKNEEASGSLLHIFVLLGPKLSICICFTDQRRQVQAHLSELQVSLASSSAAQSELREAVEAFRVKSDSYRAKLEAAEMEKVKISRSETLCTLPSFR
jgi:myosin heavy chain 9/10/11/14